MITLCTVCTVVLLYPVQYDTIHNTVSRTVSSMSVCSMQYAVCSMIEIEIEIHYHRKESFVFLGFLRTDTYDSDSK